MRLRSGIRLVSLIGILNSPGLGYAQEATVNGTVKDSTGGVLPGVSVVARNDATGNTFESVTNELGVYRIPLRPGPYVVTAQLAGFANAAAKLELLLGQQATLDLQMQPSSVQESVTVTGQAPLVDVTQSRPSGNIDPRQMQELPVNGRNWQNLSLLAPGSRSNSVGEGPTESGATGSYQLNLDGQQVTNNIAGSGFGNPHYSRDAIAEFEFIANRFEASQGRSMGVQVNAITKSGTNTRQGTVSGYFRDARFIAKDFIVNRVLPYSNQQISAIYGGPIVEDKVHYFGNYEYERQPQTFTHTTPYPRFNLDLFGVQREHKVMARLDVQKSSSTRLTARWYKYNQIQPHDPRFVGGATRAPNTDEGTDRFANGGQFTLTQVLSPRAVNEVKAGVANFVWEEYSHIRNPNSPARGSRHVRDTGTGWGSPQINFIGLLMGGRNQMPEDYNQLTYTVRDDFTLSYTKAGNHDLKLGADYMKEYFIQYVCRACVGILDANRGPIPANIEDLFPDLFDFTTWNLAPLSPITRQWQQGVGNFDYTDPRDEFAVWVQDDWKMGRLTLNLGLRYDLELNAFENSIDLGPFLRAGRPNDTNNWAPRVGFAFALTDRTVLRGGWGKYYAELGTPHPVRAFANAFVTPIANDGRADFASNPWNGRPIPTYDEAVANGCDVNPGPSCIRRDIGTSPIVSAFGHSSYSYQTSVGVQQQLGSTTAVEADYIYTGGREENGGINNNLSYNAATGANYPFTDISRRPYPDFGLVGMTIQGGWSNYHGLQTTFTKRMSHGVQASANYSLSVSRDASPLPLSGNQVVPFKLAPDFGGEYILARFDQRHRAVVNGIWQMKYGLQLSGLYFYGSGMRFSTNYGGDLRVTNGRTEGRLRPDGTIAPRNNLVGMPVHRVDMRVTRIFKLGGQRQFDGMLEVFNVFNHANYGSYTTQESNRQYGKPSQNVNVSFQPRTLQFGFRLSF